MSPTAGPGERPQGWGAGAYRVQDPQLPIIMWEWEGAELGPLSALWPLQLPFSSQTLEGCNPPDSHSAGDQLLLPLLLVVLAPGA